MNAMVNDTRHYGLERTSSVISTSECGDVLKDKPNALFVKGHAGRNVISIFPGSVRQTLKGIGSSFTESSAFVLAHLDPEKRQEVMRNIYGEEGANFSVSRAHIGACDFCVNGRYSYADVPDDQELAHFSIAVDKTGFSKTQYPDIEDEQFDLLPMIKEALSIKANQDDKTLDIMASAWTAPAWMKDIETWYIPGAPENNYQGTGGRLKAECVDTYARYLLRYLDAYQQEGVPIWALSPVNEPCGNNGQWESMHFTPHTQNDFIKTHLGPQLHATGHRDTEVLMFDHNRNELEEWADIIFADTDTAEYVSGAAVHWYESTYKVGEDILDRVHEKYPQFSIVHSEGCIDDLGKDAPEGILDPVRFKESDWFGNDTFWWNENATDWAYTATWPGVIAEDHPIYIPVHRYARNIIQSFNHWVTAWIDWNIVLDSEGGPNHVGNFCGAPIMIDTHSKQIYYTPVFHVLAQLSRTIRPGDKVVSTRLLNMDEEDLLYSCATINSDSLLSIQILNTAKQGVDCHIQIGDQYAPVPVTANSLQTVRVQL